jgi:meso-butanediol dehydrogenase/(S,S)-butanediol dehydrogenase/diacetyl reductase
MQLQDKVALITGAGGGIGQEIALRFARDGAKVALMGRTATTLDAVAELVRAAGGKALVTVGDVALAADCDAAVEAVVAAWGTVDILVNNAAIDEEVLFIDMTEAGWDSVMDVNLKGPMLLSQRAARVMREHGGGSVVHISSIDHDGVSGPYTSYNVSKTGMLALSRCMAVELAEHGIRSNVVSPGATQTDMIARVMGEEQMDYMTKRFARVPLQRLVLPEEVAAACVFLGSDESSGITGIDLVVDCGTLANLYITESLPAAVGADA